MDHYPPLGKDLFDLARERRAKLTAALAAQGLELPAAPQLETDLERVLALSGFVAQVLTQNPALLPQMAGAEDWERTYYLDGFQAKLSEFLGDLPRPRADLDPAMLNSLLGQKLREFRQREMVRIAWRDLTGRADLNETMGDLTCLAESCLVSALERLYEGLSLEFGTPREKDGRVQHPVLVAMGKLGARELNFSSDVDLIFTYPRAGSTAGGTRGRSVTNEDFFTRLCRRLIQVISTPTAVGFVFRIDMNLRPYGDSGPMVMHFEALEDYYLRQGREWERYAWIKGRPLSGSPEDRRELMETLRPFVYRRYLDYGVFESIREMKGKINREIRRKKMADNIKLGSGGIREIEFFGQVFQLIRGGVAAQLQIRPIQQVLPLLARLEYIPEAVCAELLEAYGVLRRVEHYLQMEADQQTHELPRESLARARLAAAAGFEDWVQFYHHLNRQRTRVHHHFQTLFKEPEQRQARPRESAVRELAGVWLKQLPESEAQAALAHQGYADFRRLTKLLESLRQAPATRAMSPAGRSRLDRLVPQLLAVAAKEDDPLASLERLVELVRAVARRTSYLALLLEHPAVLRRLVALMAGTPLIAGYLTRHPLLLDELLDTRTLYRPPARKELSEDIAGRRLAIAPGDLEGQIEALCVFKQINTFRVAAADVAGILPLMRTSDYLTEIAEVVLGNVLDLAWAHLTAKHGRPSASLDGRPLARGFAVIAFGKLGGLELGYGSDLDLVFLHAGTDGQTSGPRPIDNRLFYARLGERIIHILTTRTQAGFLYEADMRLRPSGSAGVLVSQVDGYETYQLEQAWTWEHQAIIRARPVTGDPALMARFDRIRRNILQRPRRSAELMEQVATMRNRLRRERITREPGKFDLKEGLGGIVDIEFLVQFLILQHSSRHPELGDWSDNVRQIRTLLSIGVLDQITAHRLKGTYLAYRIMAHHLTLQEKPALIAKTQLRTERRRIAAIWNRFLPSHPLKS